MPRSTIVKRKRNKRSTASKLSWRKIKQDRLLTTATIYSDIEEQKQLTERNSTEILINNEDICNFSDEIEVRKPDPNLKTYVASCSSKTNDPQKEYGTISSDECDRIDDHVLEYESTPKQPSSLENDMENYIRYKLVDGRIFIKKNVPHILDCWKDKKGTALTSTGNEVEDNKEATNEEIESIFLNEDLGSPIGAESPNFDNGLESMQTSEVTNNDRQAEKNRTFVEHIYEVLMELPPSKANQVRHKIYNILFQAEEESYTFVNQIGSSSSTLDPAVKVKYEIIDS